MRPEFIKNLDKFCKNIDREYGYINYGGCCVFAALLALELSKCLGVSTKILVGDRWGRAPSLNYARDNAKGPTMEDWEDTGMGFSHVIVEVTYEEKKYFVDCKGVHRSGKVESSCGSKIIKGVLSTAEAYSLGVVHGDGWNERFDRSQIPAMGKSIGRLYDKIAA